MKTIIFLCCLILCAPVVFGQKNTEAIQKEIIRLEDLGRQKALRGDANWDEIWADGAYMITALGTIIVYKKGMNLSAGGPAATSLKMTEQIVRVYGDVAVFTALMEVEAETADKKPYAFKLWFMDVWKKHDDGWKIVAAERTPVRQIPSNQEKK